MATRSIIAIRYPNNTIKAIYCHNGGAIVFNGETLLKHYTKKEKVEELISLGYISSLFETPKETFAYHRDGGEKTLDIDVYKNTEEFINTEDKRNTVYYYLFIVENNTWMVARGGNYWRNLSKEYALEKEKWDRYNEELFGNPLYH